MWENSLTPACSLVHMKSNWNNGSNLLYHIQMAQNSLPFQLKMIPFVSRSAFTPKSANRKNQRGEFKSLDWGPPKSQADTCIFLSYIHALSLEKPFCRELLTYCLSTGIGRQLLKWPRRNVHVIQLALKTNVPQIRISTFLVVVLSPFVKGSQSSQGMGFCERETLTQSHSLRFPSVAQVLIHSLKAPIVKGLNRGNRCTLHTHRMYM